MADFNRKRNALLDVFYPKQCVCCGEIIDDSEEICDVCMRNIERVDDTKRCIKCGLLKADCQCKIYVYHFEGVVAPFFNKGLARAGIYNFKFNKKAHYSLFFAREMVKVIVSQLKDVEFDAVCFVPSSLYSFSRRGFNQSELLAKDISNILSLPLIKGVLKCKFSLGFQHRLGREKRFKKVQSKYYFLNRKAGFLKDKTVLLVDDIKTTGATLDECSRQILLAGAKCVYCITALVTEKGK